MSAIISDAARPVVADSSAPASAGALLRQARQSRGLHIAALAVQLKVPQSKLEALEAERYQDLPDATFARALATAMCRALKVDAAPVLALLPRSNDKSLEGVSLGLNQPFRERSTVQGEGLSLDWLKRPVVWAPALLLIAALGVYLMPEGWPPTRQDEVTKPVAAPQTEAALEPQVAPAPVASAAEPADLKPATPLASAPAAVAGPVQQAAVEPSAKTVPGAAVGSAPVRLHATAESWVELTDAKGQVQFSRLMRAGEQAELDLQLPAQLRVGNVAGTQVLLRGVAVDVASRSKDNVARIELN